MLRFASLMVAFPVSNKCSVRGIVCFTPLAILCFFQCIRLFAAQFEPAPETASGLNPIQTEHFREAIAVTANPYASKAAQDILVAGGSAIDAAITAQLILGLVEPQSSGIGGGAFLLYWDAQRNVLSSYDGRETAPAAVDEKHFLTATKEPMKFYDAVIGGHAVGTPGLVAMLALAHKEHGKLTWASLFTPAITLAKRGFVVSPRLNKLLTWITELTPNTPQQGSFRDYFYTQKGAALSPGTLLKNPDYADTLGLLAQQGTKPFYHGQLAKNIVSAVQNDPRRTGKLALQDLQHYRAKKRTPLCRHFYQYKICGAPPPSSGAFTVLNLLGILEQHKINAGTSPINFLHLFAESSKLAFADRDTYLADPDFLAIPTVDLLSKSYLKTRAKLINPNLTMGKAFAGRPNGTTSHLEAGVSPELSATSHLSIIDRFGNIVSMTSSIEMAFGARILVNGFLLNNQLTDFSFKPTRTHDRLADNLSQESHSSTVANRIEPNKRPRSSMAPTIVFDHLGQPKLIIGSPGGSRIIDYTAKVLVQTLAMQQSLKYAIEGPHIVDLNSTIELEANRGQEKWQEALNKRGHQVLFKKHTSGLHGIWIDKSGYIGVADPRREGSVGGL